MSDEKDSRRPGPARQGLDSNSASRADAEARAEALGEGADRPVQIGEMPLGDGVGDARHGGDGPMESLPDLEGTGDGGADGPPVILQVLPALNSGGVERGTVEITEALAEAGAIALVASAGGQMEHQIERAGGRHIKLPLATKNPARIRQNAKTLQQIIRKEGVSIVHARSRAPAWSAYWACQKTAATFMTTFHNAYSMGNPLKQRYNSVMAKGERVIAISEFVGQHVRERYKVGDDRLRVVPRGVDIARFDPATISSWRVMKLAEDWRLPDGMPVIMLPGRLTRWKGHEVLIEALAKLRRDDIRCLIVGGDQGDDSYRLEMDKLVKKLGVGHLVHLVGECNDMPAAYVLSDVVVSASTRPEGFGRVIAEAQALGCPVVATNHGAAPEILEDGDTGWLVPPRDAGAMAQALGKALALNTDARENLARRAKSRIRRFYTKDLMCSRTLRVYNEILQGQ